MRHTRTSEDQLWNNTIKFLTIKVARHDSHNKTLFSLYSYLGKRGNWKYRVYSRWIQDGQSSLSVWFSVQFVALGGHHSSPFYVLIKDWSRMHVIAGFLPLPATPPTGYFVERCVLMNVFSCSQHMPMEQKYMVFPLVIFAIFSCTAVCGGLFME